MQHASKHRLSIGSRDTRSAAWAQSACGHGRFVDEHWPIGENLPEFLEASLSRHAQALADGRRRWRDRTGAEAGVERCVALNDREVPRPRRGDSAEAAKHGPADQIELRIVSVQVRETAGFRVHVVTE